MGSVFGGFFDTVGLPYWAVVLGAFAFVFGRSWAYYYGGRLIARGAKRSRWTDMLESHKFTKATAALHRYGVVAVALSFVVPGTGTAITLASGFTRMRYWRYLVGVVSGGMVWTAIRATVGLAVAKSALLLAVTNPVALGAVATAFALAALVLLCWWAVRRRGRRGEASEAIARP